ncbi:MAG: T9SS type A sorting domain-containing protein [Cyclobacteriaceae bacterium]
MLDPNDYIVLEASKDEGETWIPLTEEYNSEGKAAWITPWLNQLPGAPTMFRNRTLNLLESGDFAANDKLLIRFRLFSNASVTGWGWAMDNLSIQGPVTAVDELPGISVEAFPMPATDFLHVMWPNSSETASVRMIDLAGRTVFETTLVPSNPSLSIDVKGWSTGIYILQIAVGQHRHVKKVSVQH